MLFYTFSAGDLDRHIYHMHGYSFWVVGARQFTTMVSLEEIKELDHRGMLFTRNLINPPRKDTITIPKYGVVALRFKADSPGNYFSYFKIILIIRINDRYEIITA